MKVLGIDGLQHLWNAIKQRFYNKTEMNSFLSGKANTTHTHTSSQITDFSHTHDERYYTESEIDTKLSGKADSTHNHNGVHPTMITTHTLNKYGATVGGNHDRKAEVDRFNLPNMIVGERRFFNISCNGIDNTFYTNPKTPTSGNFFISYITANFIENFIDGVVGANTLLVTVQHNKYIKIFIERIS